MEKSSPTDVTQLLLDWNAGDQRALDRLMPLVYEELRRMAARQLRRERPEHTPGSTARWSSGTIGWVGSRPTLGLTRSGATNALSRCSGKLATDFKTDLIYQCALAPNGRDLALARGTNSIEVVAISNFR